MMFFFFFYSSYVFFDVESEIHLCRSPLFLEL